MDGLGLRKVAFVADPKELDHWMLTRLLKRARGLERDHFFFVDRDDPNLNQLIKQHDIKVLIPLGEGALRRLVGETNLERWHGRVVPHAMGIWTVPAFAPSKLLPQRGDATTEIMRNPPRFQGLWMRTVLKALDIAQNGFVRHPVKYVLDPSQAEFEKWAEGYFAAYQSNPERTWLSLDIETPYKQKNADESDQATDEQFDSHIIRISYSYAPYTAVSIPWSGEYFDAITRLNASTGIKVVWNGVSFDNPLLAQNQTPVKGTTWEAMDAYHLLESDLPKGLEWVTAECTDLLPWKHLNVAEPALYSCIDADAALRNMIELETALKRRNQWDAFLDHSVKLMPILMRAGAKGNRIDVEKQAALRIQLTEARKALHAEAQTLVGRDLKPRKLYKTQPTEVAGDFAPLLSPHRLERRDTWDIEWELDEAKFCSACGLPASNKTEHFKGGVGEPHPKTGKPTKVKNPCKLLEGVIEAKPAFVPRFYEVLDFNPNSSEQLKAYIRWAGHPMGKDKKDKTKETADAKHIEFLIKHYGTKHPIYTLVLEVHKLSKTIGTYLPEPDERGYIKTEYCNSPSTWRLGSRKVKFGTQIQNWGKREGNPWAKEAKKTIIASPGCKLIQIDSASVEAVMQGWFMGDLHYIEIASQGVHAWLACKQLGWEFNADTIAKVKAEHSNLYDQLKVTNHSTNFGGTPYMLWKSFPSLFPTLQDAERIQNTLFTLIPKLAAYQHGVRVQAQKEGYLDNPWHIRHHFYDVFTTQEDGTVKEGKDSKRVVAFKPQSSNGCFQRDSIRLVDATEYGEFLPAIANVHDSMALDCPIEKLDGAREMLLEVFTRPIPQMGGLRIGAEVEIGKNWGSYHPMKNPEGMESVQKVSVFEPGLMRTAA